MANLLDNAIRHNAPDGWVTVTTGVDGEQAVLQRRQQRAADRRRRGRAAGAAASVEQAPIAIGQAAGHGLGLSIVSAIATAHGATLAFQPQPAGGLQAEVRFPASDAS